MKHLLALVLCIFAALASPARADVELSFDYYYDQLSPMGEWAEVDGYGYVWHPNDVGEDWAPYTDGYWTYTDAGWTWVSYEDWGGICYHYGRWVRLEGYGWCWVPGYEWGPAWVSWRKNDDYIGWAPLPPECDWEADRGVSVWVDTQYDIGPLYYSFCRTRDFGAPVLRHVVLPRIRNVEICFSTVNITNITYNRDYGCVYNGGFDYDYIRERCERPVPALKLVRNTTNIYINNNRGNILINSPRGNALIVNTPRVAANFKDFTRKPAVRRTFKRDAVARGWNGLDRGEVRQRLVSKMREETKGLSPTNAPARPVRKEALAVVPKEVNLEAQPAGFKRVPAERGSRGRNGETAGAGKEPATSGREVGNGRGGREERGGMAREGRGENGAANAEKSAQPGNPPADKDTPVAGTNEPRGGIRKRPGREGAPSGPDAPVTSDPNAPKTAEQPGNDQPGRPENPRERAADRARDRIAEQREEAAKARNARAAEMQRNGQENTPSNAGNAPGAGEPQENAARQAETNRQNLLRERARENAERISNQREQAESARNAAERAQRQRDAAESGNRAAEMQRENAMKAARENAVQEQAREQARQSAANAAREAAVRRAEMQQAERAQAQRRAEQAESAQRQSEAAQQRQNAQREAAQRAAENARRQAAERQNDNARQQMMQRQAEVQRERAAAAAQQAEARQQAAQAARSRAMEAQREQAQEAARSRAMEAQRAQAQEAARARAAQAQERASEARAAQAQMQQQRAEAMARRQQQIQSQQQQSSSGESRGKGRGKRED